MLNPSTLSVQPADSIVDLLDDARRLHDRIKMLQLRYGHDQRLVAQLDDARHELTVLRLILALAADGGSDERHH